jgi:Sulfotransferase domain
MKTSILPNERSSAGSPFVRILREGAWPALRLLARPDTLAQIPRLFREGIGPAQRLFIQAHNHREMARMIREQVPMTFVSSYLRCGSTWMCYLLCDILLQNRGIRTSTELPFDRKKIILDQYARLIARRDRSADASGCIIKTHDLIPLLQEQIGGDPGIRECKYLYLYRTPEDALVSTCHLYRREKYLRSKPAYALACRDMDLFCLEFLPGLIEHVQGYLDALDEGVDVHLVSYDQLQARTAEVLTETLRWLAIPHTEAIVAHAVSNTQFSNLQAMEAKTLGGQIPFFRRGCAGAGAAELKPETLSKIRSATKDLINRADERLARQALRLQAVRESSAFRNEPQAPVGRAEAITASNGR